MVYPGFFVGGGRASAIENQDQAAAWTRRTRRIFVPYRPAGRPTMAAQIPRSGVCHQIWSRGSTPAFLWAVANLHLKLAHTICGCSANCQHTLTI